MPEKEMAGKRAGSGIFPQEVTEPFATAKVKERQGINRLGVFIKRSNPGLRH